MTPTGDHPDVSEDAQDAIGMVAHELKNALGPVAAMLQLLERRAAGGERLAPEELAQVRRQVKRAADLVNNLLDAAIVDSGQLAIDARPLDLAAVARDAVETFRAGVSREVRLEGGAGGQPLRVAGDAARLVAVLLNLLDNAAKYSPAPAPIVVTVEAAGGRARVAVADQGPGMAPEDLARLFQRYFRAPATARKAPGLGLGLFVCRRIAEEHSGRLEVDSTPGRGSTFWLDLPLVDAPEPGATLAGDGTRR